MFARSLTVVLVLISLAALPAVLLAQGSRGCVDAAASLIEASDIRLDPSAGRSGTGERTERWSSTLGHEGNCRFDASGRLYAVEITRFPAVGSGSGQRYTVTCESSGNRRRNCPLRESGSTVSLLRQLSRTRCSEGETFGVLGSTLWVDRGCRGVFQIEATWPPYVLTCASARYAREECPTREGAAVRLLRTTSRSPCTEGRSWGHAAPTLWVDRGCAGEFEVFPDVSFGAGSELDRARAACRRRVESDGMSVRGEESIRRVGRLVEVTLRTGRGTISTTTVCSFDPATGGVEIRGR